MSELIRCLGSSIDSAVQIIKVQKVWLLQEYSDAENELCWASQTGGLENISFCKVLLIDEPILTPDPFSDPKGACDVVSAHRSTTGELWLIDLVSTEPNPDNQFVCIGPMLFEGPKEEPSLAWNDVWTPGVWLAVIA